MQPTVLFYNLESEKGKKIKLLCIQQKLKIRTVYPMEFEKTLGDLLTSPSDTSSQAEETAFSEEMLVLAGVYGQKLDQFLKALRRQKLFVPLKAVLTQENVGWTSSALCQELKEEHQKIQEQQK